MRRTELATILRKVINSEQSDILRHIAGQEKKNRTGGIEGIFARALNKALPSSRRLELDLRAIGATTTVEGRSGGRIDCYIPESRTAIEYKAVRMPRTKSQGLSGVRFDIGQLIGDFERLRFAKDLDRGWIIVFVYGPLVGDARSDRDLYRRFHNQMFIDLTLAVNDHQYDRETDIWTSFKELGWTEPCAVYEASQARFGLKIGSLGAICINCRS